MNPRLLLFTTVMASAHCKKLGVALWALTVLLGTGGCLSLTSSPTVTKTIVVLPVGEDSGEVIDAVPEFVGATKDYRLAEFHGRFSAPIAWHTEIDQSGAMRITWTMKRFAREKLFLSEAGFHVVEVPVDKAFVINRRNTFSRTEAPVLLRMWGNTAYLRKQDRTSYRSTISRREGRN